MFFIPKKEEANATGMFRRSCTYNGLNVSLSKKALEALKSVITASSKNKEVELGQQDLNVLCRRGLVRVTHNGEILSTQLGLLVLALAEAAGLITSGSSVKKVEVKA